MTVEITSRNGNVVNLRGVFPHYPSLANLASAQASLGILASQPNTANIVSMDGRTYTARWTSVLNEQGEGVTLG